MMPDASGGMMVVGVEWLDLWVGHARPGARQMIGPVAMTHMIGDGLGKRVQALVGAGLIIAAWKAVPDASPDERWEWRLTRTGRDLPVCWPLLVPPRTVAARPARAIPATDVVFEMIKNAALAGRPAPSNADILKHTDVASLSSASSLITHLAQKGRIVVKRAGTARVIAIPALGIETAKVPA